MSDIKKNLIFFELYQVNCFILYRLYDRLPENLHEVRKKKILGWTPYAGRVRVMSSVEKKSHNL